MLANIYKHKASGACFLVAHKASVAEGENIVEVFECALTAQTYRRKAILFLIDKEWFVSAENTEFEKLFDDEKSHKKELTNLVQQGYLDNKAVTIEQWAAFDAILYAGMFEYKTKAEVSAQEVYEHFNPQHDKNESSTNAQKQTNGLF